MKKKYFGTDGIRGTAYKFPMNSDFLYSLARAISNNDNTIGRILIGMDTRESCEYIKNSLVNGFISYGVTCECIGVVSTPILCFYTKLSNYDMGIMISASHNPYEDNGIKIFKKNGEKLSDKEELSIEEKIFTKKNIKLKNETIQNPLNNFSEYEKFLFDKVSLPKNRLNNNIVVDCANGSLWDFAPKFFKKLNFNLFAYGCSPNGNNINQDCGALEQHKLSEMTLRHNSDIGISFDGDADRVIICDNKGKIIDGDYILAIIAYRLKKDQDKNISIVSTKMSNLSFRKYIENINIKLSLSDVGDRYVVEKMKNTNSFVGGEPSGHIIFSDNSYCGDGILTALYILGILEEEKITLSDLCDLLFIKTPQRLLNFKLTDSNQNLINSQKVEKLINKYEDKDCEIILRKSGTENVLRLMIQSSEEGDIDDFIKLFSNIINE